MRIDIPKRAKVLYSLFNQTLQNAGVLAEGGSVEPPKDQHGFLPTRILQSVLDMRTRLAEGIDTKTVLTAEFNAAGQTYREANERLNRIIRNAWTVIRQRVSRRELPKTVFATYGLTAEGKNPSDLSVTMWPVYAETWLKAEEKAAALGHTPTSAPGVADIRQVLDEFIAARTAKNKLGTALTAYNQGDFQQLEQEGKALCQVVMWELRRQMRDYDASERRQIMRNYGAKFTAPEGEGAETEPPVDGGETTQEPQAESATTPETEVPTTDPKTSEPAA